MCIKYYLINLLCILTTILKVFVNKILQIYSNKILQIYSIETNDSRFDE